MSLTSIGTNALTGSRRARKKERTRQEIYAAALRLFQTRGVDDVTIDAICHAADVARGTFFLHFPTKDALLLEYGTQATAELAGLLARHRGGAPAALRLALDFLVGRALAQAEVVRSMVRDILVRPAAIAGTDAQAHALIDLLAGIVRRGQTAGELRRGVEPALAAGMIVATYFAMVGEWARRGREIDLRTMTHQALDLALGGLAVRKRRRTRTEGR